MKEGSAIGICMAMMDGSAISEGLANIVRASGFMGLRR
jgi:hypothetical protein